MHEVQNREDAGDGKRTGRAARVKDMTSKVNTALNGFNSTQKQRAYRRHYPNDTL